MKVWVLSTCIPDECKPCFPAVFTSEAKARAEFEEAVKSAWDVVQPCDDDGEPLPFPVGNPEEANSIIADNSDMWGEYELTCHEVA